MADNEKDDHTRVQAKFGLDVKDPEFAHASVKTTERHYDRAVLWKERIAAAEMLAETLGAATPKATPEKPQRRARKHPKTANVESITR